MRDRVDGWSARRWVWAVATALMLAVCPALARSAAAADKNGLKLLKGDRIVFIGNTFAERLQLYSAFETMLTAAHPDLELTFRNLGWSADTLTLQPRPLNFGTMQEHLMRQKPSVIFACFGFNEAFAGPAGLSQFEKDLSDMLTLLSGTAWDGKAPPRVVLVSPMAQENLGGYLPDPSKHNDNLRAYTDAMRRAAEARKVIFIDLFAATSKFAADNPQHPLTYDSVHLTQFGDWVVAQMMADALELEFSSWKMEIDTGGTGSSGPVRFKVSSKLPIPPPPVKDVPASLLAHQPRVTIKRLNAGTYALNSGGKTVATASNAAWGRGVRIAGGAGHQRVEQLREMIIRKNELFFFRHRPVNGEYVFGRRAQPFGVVNFPPEMAQLDEMIAEAERKIHAASRPLEAQEFELVRTGD